MLHSLRRLLQHCGWGERRCACCGLPFSPLPTPVTPPRQSGAEHWLCTDCAAALRPCSYARCSLCGLPFPSLPLPSTPPVPCGACLQQAPPWQSLAFYGIYAHELKELLLRFKFGQDFSLLPLLGHMLAQAVGTLPPCDGIIPMPRHRSRLRAYGYNQVHELARVVAAVHALPLCADALHRTRLTPPQARLSAKERQHNPHGSFAASTLSGQHVLLVDDIMTTGATLRHAASALLDAGAASVRVAVLARTLHA